MLQWMKRGKLFLLPALLSFGMLGIVFAVSGLFPFGANTLAWGDMTQQALPFMMQLKNVAAGSDGLLYSMGNAAGMNFWGVVLFFAASPFSLLGLLVPRQDFHLLANVLVLLKMVLAACAATGFFASKSSPFPLEGGQAGALGVLYAFGGYALMYYQNIMWLDELILFPLLMMALFALLHKARVVPFALLLAASVYAQYQIGFIVVLAVLISAGLYILLYMHKAEGGAAALRLGGATALAGLLSAAAWLPALLQIGHSSRQMVEVDTKTVESFFTHVPTTLPMVLCTALIFASLAFLLRRKWLALPRVLYAFTCFCLFFIPMLVDPINKMWHGGSYQAFPVRYGFVPLLFGLMLAAAWLAQLAKQPTPARSRPAGYALFAGGFLVWALLLAYILAAHKSEADHYVRSLWGTPESLLWALAACAAAGLAFGLLMLARKKGWLCQRSFVLALCCLVAVEGIYNGLLYIGSPARGDADFRQVMVLAERMPAEAGRVKQSRKYTDANNLGAMGYASIAHYSSLTRADYITAGKKLGYSGYWMEMTGLGGTLLSDYFLNIGGVLCQRDEIDPAYHAGRALYEEGRYALVEPAVAPGGYGTVVAAQPEAIAGLPEGDRFEVQNWLYREIYGGDGELCRRYEPYAKQNISTYYDSTTRSFYAVPESADAAGLYYNIEIGERETLYFDCFSTISSNLYESVNDGFTIWVNGTLVEASYPGTSSNGLLCLGSFENATVQIYIEVLREEVMRSFGVCGMREGDVTAAVAKANMAQVAVDGSRITAQCTAAEGELLVLCLGYDEGFTAVVNGQSVPVHKVLDGFMAVPLQAGENTVELRFTPRGLVAGGWLGALGVALLALWLALGRGRAARAQKHAAALVRLRGAARVLLLALLLAALAVVYIWPLLRLLL